MNDRLHIDLIGAVPELAALRMLGHVIETTLDMLAALHPPPEPFPASLDDLVAALHDAHSLADDYALALCRDMTRPDTPADQADADDIF